MARMHPILMLLAFAAAAQGPGGVDPLDPGAQVAATYVGDQIRTAAANARRDPRNRRTLTALHQLLSKKPPQRFREPLLAALALGARLQDSDAGWSRMHRALVNTYPQGLYRELLTDEALGSPCPVCSQGKGATKPCPKCHGRKQCPNTNCNNGTVTVERFNGRLSQRQCPICGGSGTCPACDGSGVIVIRCRKCGGSGTVVTATEIDRAYRLVLADLEDLAENVAATGYRPLDQVAAMATPPDTGSRLADHVAAKPPPPPPPPPANPDQPTPNPYQPPDAPPPATPDTPETADGAKTPPKLKNAVISMGMWLQAQQRRVGGQLATHLRGGFEGPKAVLYVTASQQFIAQPPDWQDTIYDSIHRLWNMKCSSSRTIAAYGKVKLLHPDGTVLRGK